MEVEESKTATRSWARKSLRRPWREPEFGCSPEEIDLLFRVYDADSSGFLEVSEVIAAHNRANSR